jgi:imidazolonepropionase-like amidohydrolase
VIHRLALATLAAFGLCNALFALPLQDQETGAESAESKSSKKEDAKSEKTEDRWFAAVGGEVHTGTGAVLRGATILAKNGKITAIGYDVDVPPEAKKLDAAGMLVYPGIVAISSQGLVGNAGSDFEDTIDPFNSRMILGLSSGITTTGVAGNAVKLCRFSVHDPVVREKVYTILTWSDRNPPSKRGLREKFQKAAEYLRQYRDWEEKVKKDKDLKEPAKKDVDTTILSVLKNETMAKFTANDRNEILGIARLAQEFGFRPVVEGCMEGWTVADELGRAGAFAIITPRDRRAKDEQLAAEGGSSIKNAAILRQAGVQVAVTPASEGVDLGGLVGRDIMAIAIEADFAVRGGLSEEAALAAITIVPARIMGVSHRVGTLEIGKDCDLIVTDGDLLHYKTFVQYAVVDGKLAYDKEKELFFAHIRPRPPATPPEKKLDKGESQTAPAEEKTGEAKAKEEEKKDEPPKDEPKKDEKKDEPKNDEPKVGEPKR